MKQRCVVVDVETIGLSPRRGDRIIEIGAVAVEDGRIVGEFHSLVNAGRRIPAVVSRINGITDGMLIGQPRPEEALPKFHRFIGSALLVAHNARFDVGFLMHEFARERLMLANRHVCTLQMSRIRWPSLSDHKLETVYRHLFGEMRPDVQRHRALDDARLTARIWMEMMGNG